MLIYLIKLIKKVIFIKKPGRGGTPAKFKKNKILNSITTKKVLLLLVELFKLTNLNPLNIKKLIVVINT